MLPDDLYERLRALGRARGTSAASLLRDAVEAYVANQTPNHGPLDALVGLLDGPPAPLGADTGTIAAEAAVTKSDQVSRAWFDPDIDTTK